MGGVERPRELWLLSALLWVAAYMGCSGSREPAVDQGETAADHRDVALVEARASLVQELTIVHEAALAKQRKMYEQKLATFQAEMHADAAQRDAELESLRAEVARLAPPSPSKPVHECTPLQRKSALCGWNYRPVFQDLGPFQF